MNNMLTVEEVKNFLEIDQTEVETLLKDGKLRAYKIGGTYIRFRKEEVIHLRYEILPKQQTQLPRDRISSWAKITEFWRFNNFYIISTLIVGALIFYFLRT